MSKVIEQAPFRSVDDALKFAFRFEYEAYERSALAQLASGPSSPGKGLGGLDGAATAGIIGMHLATIPQLWRRILIARYSPRSTECECGRSCCSGYKPNHLWQSEITWLSESVLMALTATISNRRLRNGIVLKYFGQRIKLGELADYCKVHRDTASDHAHKIITMLKVEEKAAYNAIDERLRSVGMIGE